MNKDTLKHSAPALMQIGEKADKDTIAQVRRNLNATSFGIVSCMSGVPLHGLQ